MLASLSEGYGVGVLLYATSSASLAAVHVGASTTGALMLLVPGVATTLTPEQRIMRNDFSPTLFGVKLALLLQVLAQKAAHSPRFGSKSGALSTCWLQKWRTLHVLAQKAAHSPRFGSKSGALSTFWTLHFLDPPPPPLTTLHH